MMDSKCLPIYENFADTRLRVSLQRKRTNSILVETDSVSANLDAVHSPAGQYSVFRFSR